MDDESKEPINRQQLTLYSTLRPSFCRKLKKQLERLCNTAAGRELPDCRDPSLFSATTTTTQRALASPTDLVLSNASTAVSSTTTATTAFDSFCEEILAAGGGNVTPGSLAAAGCNTTVFNGE